MSYRTILESQETLGKSQIWPIAQSPFQKLYLKQKIRFQTFCPGL